LSSRSFYPLPPPLKKKIPNDLLCVDMFELAEGRILFYKYSWLPLKITEKINTGNTGLKKTLKSSLLFRQVAFKFCLPCVSPNLHFYLFVKLLA